MRVQAITRKGGATADNRAAVGDRAAILQIDAGACGSGRLVRIFSASRTAALDDAGARVINRRLAVGKYSVATLSCSKKTKSADAALNHTAVGYTSGGSRRQKINAVTTRPASVIPSSAVAPQQLASVVNLSGRLQFHGAGALAPDSRAAAANAAANRSGIIEDAS